MDDSKVQKDTDNSNNTILISNLPWCSGVNFTNIFTFGFFCTKVIREAFFTYFLGLNLFWRKNIGAQMCSYNVSEIGHMGL